MKKLFLLLITAAFLNDSWAQSFDSLLQRYGSMIPQEKAWLHFDKSAYLPGETVWFKAYVVEELFPAEASKTLYIDWIDEQGAVLSHTVSPLVSGVSNGQFDIPSGIKGNFIHIRAYTRWMLNFDTAFLYARNIRVLSQTPPAPVKPVAIIPSLEFFPEGGDLVNGVVNRIAFKARDQWGQPIKIRGVVQDKNGEVVDSLRIIHDGMGSFYFTPREGQDYTAQWVDERGGRHQTALPKAQASGISMNVMLGENRRIITINSTANLPESMRSLHLVGTINQRLAFRTELSLTPGNPVRRIIPVNSLPSGILTITIFDQNWKALAERISFVYHQDFSFSPTLEVKHWGLGKRKRNELEVRIPDSLAGANLSISVTDAAIEHDTTEHIMSHFLLSSDIRGKVHNPRYYFTNHNEKVALHLDLVMMTNGWRRIKWEDLTKGKLPVISHPRDTSYLALSGKVFGVAKSQLTGNETIVLLVKERDSSTRMLLMPIETNGNFSDPNIVLFDTIQVYYSLKSKFLKQAEARFMTDRLPAPDYTGFARTIRPPTLAFDTSGTARHRSLALEEARLRALERGKVMEMVTVTAKQKTTLQLLEERYPTGMFKGGDGIQFDLVSDPSSIAYTSVLQYLQGRVAGLQVTMTGGSAQLSWRGGTPALFLDEINSDPEMINMVPVSDIAYVKVFRPPFMGSSSGGSGAIAVYTKKGNDVQSTSQGLTSNRIAGYTPIRQFYAPNYDRPEPTHSQPDLRTTIYWNPMVNLTSKKKNMVLSFYNSDSTKSFRVVVEGITPEGLYTHHEEILE
jgi:hypothetical protein